MGTHPIFESDFDCLTEDFVFDQTVRFLFRDQANHITVHITTLNTE